jgi:hypothetical protein
VHRLKRATEHPAPFASALWAHVETIKRMRLARKSWVAIARHLETDHGIKVSPPTLYNFMRRYARRARAGTIPLGFEPLQVAPPSSVYPKPTLPKSEGAPDPDDAGSIYDQAQEEALRQKTESKPPLEAKPGTLI